MKSLEAAKDRHAREQARLDEVLATAICELMPLIEGINRANRDLVFSAHKAMQTLKLTAKRRHWFGDLLSGKAADLLADPVGLSEEEIGMLEAIIEELDPRGDDLEMSESEEEDFDFVRMMMEQAAHTTGPSPARYRSNGNSTRS